ncbi:MAG: secretin and TonB N-terminal domain-containing protein [Tannerellaceae bacterium]|nr:secretin and TonB N-terminal domain-containing protein [Tannerellaceae bacterium]
MKLTTFIILVFSLQLSAKGLAQTVTLSVKDAPVQKVLTEISRQTGYSMVYKESYFGNNDRVTMDVHNKPVEQVLDLVLGQKNYSFSIRNGMVVIRKKVKQFRNYKQHQIKVVGKVTDEDGNPLSDVDIEVEGTSQGAATNRDGVFFLES